MTARASIPSRFLLAVLAVLLLFPAASAAAQEEAADPAAAPVADLLPDCSDVKDLPRDFSEEALERIRSGEWGISQTVSGRRDMGRLCEGVVAAGAGACVYNDDSGLGECAMPRTAGSSSVRPPTEEECLAGISEGALAAAATAATIEGEGWLRRAWRSYRYDVVAGGRFTNLFFAALHRILPGDGDFSDGIIGNQLEANTRYAGEINALEACLALAAVDVSRTSIPAWRWRGSTELSTDFGFTSFRNVINLVSSMLFMLASSLWGWLLDLIREGTSLEVLSGRAHQINTLFNGMADAVRTSGLAVIAGVLALFASLSLFMRGRGAAAARTFVTSAVALSLLVAMAAATQIGTIEDLQQGAVDLQLSPDNLQRMIEGLENMDPEYGVPRGSPGWLGLKGADTVGSIARGLMSGFGSVTPGSGVFDAIVGRDSDTMCAAYVGELYEQAEAAAPSGVADGQPAGATSDPSKVISMLWHAGLVNPWLVSQYGSVSSGEEIYCFEMERRAGVPSSVQSNILQEATDAPRFSPEVFAPVSREDEARARMFAWAACSPSNNGAMRPDPEWVKVSSDVTADNCEGWFLRGETTLIEGLTFEDLNSLRDRIAVTSAGVADSADAFRTFEAFVGENRGQRFAQSALALVVAGIYLYAFGGIAVGSILAQYGLFMLLALLPVTLVLLAFPGPEGRRGSAGSKMLKLTGTLFLVKLILELVLMVMMQIVNALSSLATAVNLSEGISAAGVPLASVFIMKKLLQTMGLGNIMSLTGATALTLNAATAATRDKDMTRAVSSSLNRNEGGELKRIGRMLGAPSRYMRNKRQNAYYKGRVWGKRLDRGKRLARWATPRAKRAASAAAIQANRMELGRREDKADELSDELEAGLPPGVAPGSARAAEIRSFSHRKIQEETIRNEERAAEIEGRLSPEEIAAQSDTLRRAAAAEQAAFSAQVNTMSATKEKYQRDIDALAAQGADISYEDLARKIDLERIVSLIDEQIVDLIAARSERVLEDLEGSLDSLRNQVSASQQRHDAKWRRSTSTGPTLPTNPPPIGPGSSP